VAAQPEILSDTPPGRADRSIRIRPAAGDDAAALLPYWVQIGTESPYLTFGPEGPGTSEEEQRKFLEQVRGSDNGLALVAVDGDVIVGCLTFSCSDRARMRHGGEFGVSILQAYWGLGIGRRLVEMLVAWAAEGSVVRKINLRVHADNERAIVLYQSLGFSTEGRLTRDSLVDGQFFDCLMMGRAIDSGECPEGMEG
jgi:RimJ/RimL family protein N-acetyltransferase